MKRRGRILMVWLALCVLAMALPLAAFARTPAIGSFLTGVGCPATRPSEFPFKKFHPWVSSSVYVYFFKIHPLGVLHAFKFFHPRGNWRV